MKLLPAQGALVAKRTPLLHGMRDARGVVHETTKYDTERRRPPREVRLAALAERQHGVVSLAQLRELGWTPEAVPSRVASGKLHRIHRGVYSVGHPILSDFGRAKA